MTQRDWESIDPPRDRAGIHPTTDDANSLIEGENTDRISVHPHRRGYLVVFAALGLLTFVYGIDLIATSGTIPRGTTIAGVRVGGLGVVEAEERLRVELAPRAARPISVVLGGVRGKIDPAEIDLKIDWEGTVAQAKSQPLNPLTRAASLVTEREIGVVSASDSAAMKSVLEKLAPVVDKAPVEGSVQFVDGAPVPIDPQVGLRLDVSRAAEVVQRDWASARAVTLPVVELSPTTTTTADVASAIDQVARPAVSGSITVVGSGATRGTINARVIASALTFRAESGQLLPEINRDKLTDALRPQLAPSERPARDAALKFESGKPVTVPSEVGRVVDYMATLTNLLPALISNQDRTITAIYIDRPAAFTTTDLGNLGAPKVIGEFETGGFATDSGLNIKRAAAQVDGMVVGPGETFSLNAATNPRNAAAGYVEAGTIENGRPARGVGGGVSQLATTLYNAAYFAGMADVEHQEHSFYIGRYPAGREATVFGDLIDVKFRNDSPTGVLIQTEWTPTALTVRLVGIKRYEVTSTSGPRTKTTNPNTVVIPAGQRCSASGGTSGFTITDTRTLREISTGQSRTETRTVRYNAAPRVICAG